MTDPLRLHIFLLGLFPGGRTAFDAGSFFRCCIFCQASGRISCPNLKQAVLLEQQLQGQQQGRLQLEQDSS